MRSRKNFLTFLADRNGLTYYVKAGLVLKDNNPSPLPHDSTTWRQDGISFARNTTYYGINRAFTDGLKFVGDAATIIRYLFYMQKGVEQELYLLIWEWNDENDTYEKYYRGELDMSTFNDLAAEGVQVNTIEGGLLKLLKANENTVYQLPLDGSIPENINVNIDGILFQDTFRYSFIALSTIRDSKALGISYNGNTVDNIGIEKGTQDFDLITGSFQDYASSSKNYLFSSASPITLIIQGGFSITCVENLLASNTVVSFYTSLNNEYNIVNEILSTGVTKSYTINKTITLAANEELFVLFNSRASVNSISQSDFTIQFASRFKATQTWAIKVADVFKLLVQNITNNLYPSVSNLLSQWSNLVMTSGDALRAWSYIPTPDVPAQPIVLKISLKDLWDTVNPVLNASLGNTTLNGLDTLFIEAKSYVFDSSSITVDLGEVSEMETSFATDLLFNTLKIGYPEQNYDQQSGKQEYNLTQQYKAPITVLQKELSLISKSRADSRGIEFTRFNTTPGPSTTNNASDNSVFLLDVDVSSTSATSSFVATKGTFISQTLNLEADITFDTYNGDTTNVTVDSTKTKFTFKGPSQSIKITASLNVSGATAQMKINVNGSLVTSTTGGGFLQVATTVLVNQNDIVSVHVVPLGGGTVIIEDGSLALAFSKMLLYNLRRLNYDAISGVDNPTTAYNVELSPKSNLFRWGNYLRSILFQFGFNNLTFQTATKNYLLSRTLLGKTIFEGGDVLISSLDAPLFYPLYFKFKSQVPWNFSKLMTSVANAHIQFEYNGKKFFGFPMEVKQQYALNEAQEWKLLASPLINLADLQNLDIDGLNFLNLMPNSMMIPDLSPVQFVPLNNTLPAQYHFKHMDGWWHSEQVQMYLDSRTYFQPWQQNDIIDLQCITNGLGPVSVQFYDANGNVVLTDSLTQTTDAAVASPTILYQKSFGLSSFNPGIYYIVLTAGTGGTVVQFISEPLNIQVDHSNTLLFEYSNSRNKQSTIFSSGYSPSMRVEGWLDGYMPGAHFTAYEDQPSDVTVINGIPYDTHVLNIGSPQASNAWGVPNWVIKKLNKILILDNTSCDGLGITRNLDKEFTRVDVPGWPMKYWILEIREAKNRDGVTLTTTGELDQNVTVEYNINTNGFGDGDKGDNVVVIPLID
jgi:hypothetical protein